MIRNALAELKGALAAAEPHKGTTAVAVLHALIRGLPQPTLGRPPVYRAVRGFKVPVEIGAGQGAFDTWLGINVGDDPLDRRFILRPDGTDVVLTDASYSRLAVYTNVRDAAELLRKAVNRIQRLQTKWAADRKYVIKFDDKGQRHRVLRTQAAAEPGHAYGLPEIAEELRELPKETYRGHGVAIALDASGGVFFATTLTGAGIGFIEPDHGNRIRLRVNNTLDVVAGKVASLDQLARYVRTFAERVSTKYQAHAAAEPQSPEAFWNEVLQSIAAAKPVHHLTRGKDKLVVSGDLARSRITASMFRGSVEFNAMVYREEATQPQNMLLRFEQVSMGPKGTRREDQRVLTPIANMTPETLRRNILSHLFNSAVSSINARENERRGR